MRGAWIERFRDVVIRDSRVSPPMRGRGSKPFADAPLERSRAKVAPHAGAWIETS